MANNNYGSRANYSTIIIHYAIPLNTAFITPAYLISSDIFGSLNMCALNSGTHLLGLE